MPEPDILADDCDDVDHLERELQELGWQPVLMRDEATGMPFTRWYPPRTTGLPVGKAHAPQSPPVSQLKEGNDEPETNHVCSETDRAQR